MKKAILINLDWVIVGAFFFLLCLLAIVRGGPVFEPLVNSRLALNFAQLSIVLLVVALIFLREKVINIFVMFFPLVFAFASYEGLKHMHASAITLWLGVMPKDDLMLRIDEVLFGKTPLLWLDEWGLGDGLFIKIMAVSYSLYYLMPFFVLSYLFIRGDIKKFLVVRRGLIFGLYGGYLCYILIPVAGPMAGDIKLEPLFYENALSYEYIYQNFRYSFDCFPSLHTAIPWILVILSWSALSSKMKFLLCAISIMITMSTIALRYHYGIDVIAGVVWAIICSFFACKTWRLSEAEKELNAMPS